MKDEKALREDLELKKYAEDNGFTLRYKDIDVKRIEKGLIPGDAPAFIKNGYEVWSCGRAHPDFKMWWRRARDNGNKFVDFVDFDTLKEALDSVPEEKE